MIEWRLFEVKQQVSTWMGDHEVGCSSYTTPKGMLRPQYQSRAKRWRGLIAIM